jgi:hypothetical protein
LKNLLLVCIFSLLSARVPESELAAAESNPFVGDPDEGVLDRGVWCDVHPLLLQNENENENERDFAYLGIGGFIHGLGVGGRVSSCGCSQIVGDLSQVGTAEVGDRVGAMTRRGAHALAGIGSGEHWGWV